MARPGFNLTGMDIVLKNFTAKTTGMKIKALRGMVKGAAKVRRDMDKSSPKIPVDVGNLRASWFISTVLGIQSGEGGAVFTEMKNGKRARREGFALEMAMEHASVTSRAVSIVKSATNMTLIMGFSANYAIWVHEMGVTVRKGMNINWTRPGSGAWFFRYHINNNINNIRQYIVNEMKIK